MAEASVREERMPRATNRYLFEWIVFEWAGKLSSWFTGGPYCRFMVLLDAGGVAERVVFRATPDTYDEEEWSSMRDRASAWIEYDPFDAPEYAYVSWDCVQQQTMERLVGHAFGHDELSAEGKTIDFPSQWGVMF